MSSTLINDIAVRSKMEIIGRHCIEFLSVGHFDLVEERTGGRYLSSAELRSGVRALGGVLIPTPEWMWDRISLYASDESMSAGYDYVVPLWTADGPTDVGLSVHLVPTGTGPLNPEIVGFVPLEPANPESWPVLPPPTSSGPSIRTDAGSADPAPVRWRPILEGLVHRLVIGDYPGLAADGLIHYVTDPTDVSVGDWITEIGVHLIDLPEEAWAYSMFIPYEDLSAWSVIVPLFTVEEGWSSLKMEATVWDDGSSIVAKVDSVHED